jgi:hypothetical protein
MTQLSGDITLHDSVGTPTADTYISVASADEYMDARELNEPWLNISLNSTGTLSATNRKGNLLKQAAREIDTILRFQGTKYGIDLPGDSHYQIMQFPRSMNVDANGYPYIPQEVKYAQAEQALWILERGGRKTDENGNVIARQMISDEATIYLKPWVTRAVDSKGKYPWEGSPF